MPIPRTLGALNLNDRVQTFFDKDDVQGVRKITSEYVPRSNGQTVITLADLSTRIIVVYMKFQEYFDNDPELPVGYTAVSWEDYQDLLEEQVSVLYTRAQGHKYTASVSQPKGTPIDKPKGIEVDRPVRWMQVSFQLTCENALHA